MIDTLFNLLIKINTYLFYGLVKAKERISARLNELKQLTFGTTYFLGLFHRNDVPKMRYIFSSNVGGGSETENGVILKVLEIFLSLESNPSAFFKGETSIDT